MDAESLKEELKSGGAYPLGPVSAWPIQRHLDLVKHLPPISGHKDYTPKHQYRATTVEASSAKMIGGLLKTAGQAIRHGKVSAEIREERYDTCKACPFFVESSKRCSACGCFMEAKTWVGGDPKQLCPKKKWSR